MAWRWVRSGAASLVLATVAGGVAAQDLDAGKSAQQLFSSACTACHRGPQGLAKGRSPGAIAGFLAQHYTSGKRSAGELGAYLAAVGGDKPAPTRGAAPAAPAARTAATEPKPGAAAPPGREAGAKPTPARAAAEQQRQEAARVPAMRPRRPGEPATVAADPDPVVLSSEPMPLMHARAASRAQEQRQPPPVARTAALPVPTAPAAPAVPASTPAPTPAVADGPHPAAPAAAMGGPESAPAADVPAAAGVPAAAAAEADAAARQVFSAPLP